MKISIPVPCREDRDAMAATGNGAYCQKCAHEVIDFTKKTPDEIRETLRQNSNHRVCGFISPIQMELVNSDFHVWENQPAKVFQSKFLYACVLVFGLSLFTACGHSPGNEKTDGAQIEQEIEQEQTIALGMMETFPGDSIPECTTPADTINTGEYSPTTDLKGRINCE